jgi:tetratricopeptide (TPR) repeat protein
LAADSVPDSRQHERGEPAHVQHLVELGYVDPDDIASSDAARRRQLKEQLNQAIELNRQGRGQQAAALLLELAAADPEWIPPHQLLAEIYYRSGQLAETEAQLGWLAYHGVDTARVAVIAAGVALMRRDMQTSLRELEYARAVEPELPSVNTLLGTVLFRLGRWDDAEDAFREASQQNPADARARDGLAAIHLQHEDYEEAADWALRALEQDIHLFRAHYHLGVALASMNRPEEAIAALETSARTDAARIAPYYWLSQISELQLHDPARSEKYRASARDIIRRRRELRRKQ